MPFENLSPDADNAFYAAGLHEEVVNRLSKLRSLNVISRASVLRYSENPPPICEIAKQLNVETLMRGSVRFEGGRIRVVMNLIDARSEQNLWSETYDSNFSNVFGVQSDIATNVANAMSVKFSPQERADVLEQPTGSSEAYALYLRAWNTGGIAAVRPGLRSHQGRLTAARADWRSLARRPLPDPIADRVVRRAATSADLRCWTRFHAPLGQPSQPRGASPYL